MDMPVEQSGPDPSGETFVYVDIGSVDNASKQIAARKEMRVCEAPSRAKQVLRQGDVLVSMTRPNLNAVALVSNEFDGSIGSTGFHVLRSCCVEPLWLFYAVQTQDFVSAMCGVVQGALYPAVRPKDIARWTFALPPRREQQRIADTLDELLSDLDAGVAALERVRAKLKHYRAAVLKAAVEGTLTAEWRRQHPATETADALLTRILAERRHRWEQAQLAKFEAAGKAPPKDWKAKYVEPVAPDTAGLPELPREWRWSSLDQLGKLDRGRSKHRPRDAPHLYDGPYPFIQTGDVRRASQYVRSHSQTYSEAGLLQSKLWPEGTLCITIAANIAEAAILAYPACFPDSIVGALLPEQLVSARFVLSFINHARSRISAYASATAQKNINNEILRAIAIPLPPIFEQAAIVEAVEDQLSVIDHLERDLDARLASAQSLRQSILRHAFSGQLVPQDPNDEPASELLKRIAAERDERARVMRAAKQAKPKSPSKSRTPRRCAAEKQ